MNTTKIFDRRMVKNCYIFFALGMGILIVCGLIASFIGTDFGRVEVVKTAIQNYNGLVFTAKIYRPSGVTSEDKLPGILYVHGYQSCRETSDPYCLELARRGFIVLNIDAIGRGNSDVAINEKDPDFDTSFGAKTALLYLRSLPYVNKDAIGLAGHSLGAGIVYNLAMNDPRIRALVIVGNAYQDDVTFSRPVNMLMIFARWDEFRKRMTATTNFYREWMNSPRTKKAINVPDPQFGKTYGNFQSGTARKVFVPNTVHIAETHSHAAIKEACLWMKEALNPSPQYWVDASKQRWAIKEWCSLIAMFVGFATLLPLGVILLNLNFFSSLRIKHDSQYRYTSSPQDTRKAAIINTLLVWLYVPAIFIVFAIHKFVIRIDSVFPLMVVNAIVWWFLLSNTIGFFLFKRWFHKQSKEPNIGLYDLGLSFKNERFFLDPLALGKTLLLAVILFLCIYIMEFFLEFFFMMDFRFIFSFASDLTPYRTLLFLQYAPFLLVGFIFNGIFLHSQIRQPKKASWLKTYLSASLFNILIMVIPLILLLLVQYVPLYVSGYVPITGPGDMLVLFIQNIYHIIGVLLIILPLSTWFFQLTGKIYLGATLNALIVSWMFTSTQVIAPIPV